jgi:hypothetical protein
MWSEEGRRVEGRRRQLTLRAIAPRQIIIISVTPCPGSSSAALSMLSLSSRAFALRSPSSLFAAPQTPSHVIARTIRQFLAPTEPTRRDSDVDQAQAASSNSMDQITDILDDADLSKAPRSTNFSGKPLDASANQLSLSVPATPVGAKFERVRRGRLPIDQRVRCRAVLKFFFSFQHLFLIISI